MFANSFEEVLKDRQSWRGQESCTYYVVLELSLVADLVAEMGHVGAY